MAGNLEQNPNGGGNGPSCRTAEIIPLGDDTLYLVGTSTGLFGTTNLNGINTIWKQIGAETIGSVVVEFLTYRQNDGLLVVATHGNGIYETNLTSVTDVLTLEDTYHESFNYSIFPNASTSCQTCFTQFSNDFKHVFKQFSNSSHQVFLVGSKPK